jgi:tetratricopeptide (TPR) repeat protein
MLAAQQLVKLGKNLGRKGVYASFRLGRMPYCKLFIIETRIPNMRFPESFIALVLALAVAPVLAATDEAATASYDEIRAAAASLDQYVGSYPLRFPSDAVRDQVDAKWQSTMKQAWAFEKKHGRTEQTLHLLAELYRQGHNMDVENTAANALEVIDECLKRFPESINCHLSASYFYLSINPKYAPKGQASLLWLRARLAPEVNEDVERGLIFAYLYQKRPLEALAQAEYFLQHYPNSEVAKKFREHAKAGNTIGFSLLTK